MQRPYVMLLAVAQVVVGGLFLCSVRSSLLASALHVAWEAERSGLTIDVSNQAALLARAPERELQDRALSKRLRSDIVRHVVPAGQGLPWVAGQLEVYAKASGLQVEAVTEIEAPAPWGDSVSRWGRRFTPLPVRIQGKGLSQQIVKLLAALEGENPFLTLKSLLLLEDRETPELTRFDLVVQWPMWVNAETERWFVERLGASP